MKNFHEHNNFIVNREQPGLPLIANNAGMIFHQRAFDAFLISHVSKAAFKNPGLGFMLFSGTPMDLESFDLRTTDMDLPLPNKEVVRLLPQGNVKSPKIVTCKVQSRVTFYTILSSSYLEIALPENVGTSYIDNVRQHFKHFWRQVILEAKQNTNIKFSSIEFTSPTFLIDPFSEVDIAGAETTGDIVNSEIIFTQDEKADGTYISSQYRQDFVRIFLSRKDAEKIFAALFGEENGTIYVSQQLIDGEKEDGQLFIDVPYEAIHCVSLYVYRSEFRINL